MSPDNVVELRDTELVQEQHEHGPSIRERIERALRAFLHDPEEAGCVQCRHPVDIADCAWVTGYVHKGRCEVKFEARQIALPILEKASSLVYFAIGVVAILYLIVTTIGPA